MNHNKKIIARVQLVQKHSTQQMKDKQQGRLERNVDSSNLNGLCTGFSFQYNTIPDHKKNIIRKYLKREQVQSYFLNSVETQDYSYCSTSCWCNYGTSK